MANYIGLPEDTFNSLMAAAGSLPANQVRRLLNDVEAQARRLDVNAPQPLDMEVVTEEEKRAAQDEGK